MLRKVWGAGILGSEAFLVRCEADVENGFPQISLIGSPSTAVRESAERVRTAVANSGFRLEPKRVTLNLSPADLRKNGCSYDLPIAVSLLSAYGLLPETALEGCLFVGELSLGGDILPVNGVLPMVYAAVEAGIRRCCLPPGNLKEGLLVGDAECGCAATLRELIDVLTRHQPLCSTPPVSPEPPEPQIPDFSEVRGQHMAKRAALLAAGGRHSLLYIGPAGTGKSMLASRLPGIMPDMTGEEQLELTRIYSIAGLLSGEAPLMKVRPFRSPHHTISPHAMAGGGVIPSPGEVSLANHGILFLDELPEFRPQAIEILRQPMEEGVIRISRVSGSYVFPAGFQLVCAMNPCKCGFYPDRKRCRCTLSQVRSYIGRVSRPLLDRIDLCAEVSAIPYEDLRETAGSPGNPSLSSAAMKEEVMRVRRVQENRFRGTSLRFNSEMGPEEIREFCRLPEESEAYLKRCYEKGGLSARGLHRLLKVARTAADFDRKEVIGIEQIAEAAAYRSVTDKYWASGHTV